MVVRSVVQGMTIGLLPAAGLAQRLGIDTPKELLHHRGQAIIDYGIDLLLAAPVDRLVIVIRQGKEAIRRHVEQKYADFPVEFVFQTGDIGRLIDAVKASYPVIRNHNVYFCLADTEISPNPFRFALQKELALFCFRAPQEWRHFGVVDVADRRIVDKPVDYVSDICWGALAWQPSFTEKIMNGDDLTAVMNQSDWDYHLCIDRYVDIGLKPERKPHETDPNA